VGPEQQVLTSDGPKLTIGGVSGIHIALSKLDRQIDQSVLFCRSGPSSDGPQLDNLLTYGRQC
jgi:hypothetical protein